MELLGEIVINETIMEETDIIQARIGWRTSRLRTEIDGPGVRTLVPFTGCPLRCKLCINKDLTGPDCQGDIMTPEELLEKLKIDDIYFRASGGGITFGGGEPLLRADFIKRFRELCPTEWNIAVETSLNVPIENISLLKDVVDIWIVDIKDMNPEIYLKYTERPIDNMLANLDYLVHQGLQERILARVPHIPGFNTQEDVDESLRKLKSMGIKTDEFSYVEEIPDSPTTGIIDGEENDRGKWSPNWPIIFGWIIGIGAGVACGFFCETTTARILASIVVAIITGLITNVVVDDIIKDREKKKKNPPLMGCPSYPPGFWDDLEEDDETL